MNPTLPSLRIGRLEAEFPVLLGGMSTRLTGAALAGAVANEGGFGTLGGAGLGMHADTRDQADYFKSSKAILKRELRDALELSNDGHIGVNLMVAVTDYEDLVRVAVENRAKFIVSGAGLPLGLPDFVKKYRLSRQPQPELIPIVSSVRAAALILRKWGQSGVTPAAFVVETPNAAGGHLGVTRADDIGKDALSLGVVVPALSHLLEASGHDIPVIAAGGIWDSDDIAHVMSPEIGASGVQVATRFIASDECNASEAFKDRHANNTDPIVVIHSPVGMPGRAIENDFVRKVNDGVVIDLGTCVKCLRVCRHRDDRRLSFCIVRALDNVRVGHVEEGVLFTGSNGQRIREDREAGIRSARQIMHRLTGAR